MTMMSDHGGRVARSFSKSSGQIVGEDRGKVDVVQKDDFLPDPARQHPVEELLREGKVVDGRAVDLVYLRRELDLEVHPRHDAQGALGALEEAVEVEARA